MVLLIPAIVGIFIICLFVAGIVYGNAEDKRDPSDDRGQGLILGNSIGLIVSIIVLIISLVSIANAQEMEQITNREKVENIGFNYLFKGDKGDEVCLYVDGDQILDKDDGDGISNVFYCEEKP